MGRRISKLLVFFAVIVCAILIMVVGYLYGKKYVTQQNNRFNFLSNMKDKQGNFPITAKTPGAVEVFVPNAADSKTIAKILKQQGLITNEFAFTLISKFNGFDGNYKYGTHFLLRNMSFDEIMVILTNQPKPISITLLEGMTYRQMRDTMLKSGMRFNPAVMDQMVKHPDIFNDYKFLQNIKFPSDRVWKLQGYLWPDTYNFDANATEEEILRTLLNNTESKIADGDYIAKAKSHDMTLDEVFTLASIVQSEAGFGEMPMIGKVFMNRLAAEMPLESCATINYLRSEDSKDKVMWASSDDLKTYADNPYNTYAHKGLPPGPINSPGIAAIEGVLWPMTEHSWEGADNYLYFCADGKGHNVFAFTLEEQEANVAKYSKNYD